MKRGYVTGSHGKMVGRSYVDGKNNSLKEFGEQIGTGLAEALDKELKGWYGKGSSGIPNINVGGGKTETKQEKSGGGGDKSGGGGDKSGGGGGNKKGSSSSSDDSSSKKEDNLIDWIEVLLKKIDRQLEMTKSSAEAQDKYNKKLKEYNEAISIVLQNRKQNQKAYDAYMTQAAKSGKGLSKETIDKIKNGTIQIEDVKDEDVRNKISNYQKWYEKALACKDTINDLNLELTELSQKKLDSVIEYFDTFIDRLEALSGAAESRSDMYVSKLGWGRASDYRISRKYMKQELAKLQKEYAEYEAEYHRQIRLGKNGGIVKGSTRDAEARKQLTEIRDKIYQMTAEIYDIDDKIKEVAKQRSETFAAPYEAFNDYLNQRASMWSAENDLYNMQHGQDSVAMLRKQGTYINTNLSSLQQELESQQRAHQEALANKEYKKGDIAYTEAITNLTRLRTEAYETQKQLAEVNKRIVEANWASWNKNLAVIQHYQNSLSSINSLLAEFNTFDPDTAKITEYGSAQVNMYALNMREARQEVAEYQAALEQLDKEYKSGQISKYDYDTKYREMYEGELGAAKKVQESRKAIIDTVRKGIEAETAAMSKLIEKRKEALQRQKEADNYARSIRDKNKEIARIQSQITALSGDTTEPTRAKVRKLQADLLDKQQELEDARRDHEYSAVNQGLDDELQTFKDTQDEKTLALTSSLEYQDQIIKDALHVTQEDFKSTLGIIQGLANEYGISIPKALTERLGTFNLDAAEAQFKRLLEQSQQILEAQGKFGTGKPITDETTDWDKLPETEEVKAEELEQKLRKAQAKLQEAKAEKDENTNRKTWAKNIKDSLQGDYDRITYKDSLYSTKKNNTPFRDAANSKGKIIAKLKEGTEVQYTGTKSGNWYQVKYNGKTGWIHKDNVQKKNTLSSVEKSVLSEYKGAQADYDAATTAQSTLDKNYKTAEKAYEELLRDYEAYNKKQAEAINKETNSLLKNATKVNVATTSANDNTYQYVTTKDDLPLREKQGDGKILKKIPKGSVVEYTGKTAGVWYQVKYNGQTGWVHSSYLTPKDIIASEKINLMPTNSIKLGSSLANFLAGSFAKGTKSSPRGLALTDEQGLGSEAIITKKGVLRELDAGSMVFSKAQKENLWEMSKINVSSILGNIGRNTPTMMVQNSYGSLITVNGNVDRDALPELKTIVNMAVEKTKQDIFDTMVKRGMGKR